MKFLKAITILFLVLTIVCYGAVFITRSNDLTPSTLSLFGAIFCPIMTLISWGMLIEEKEMQKGEV